MPSPARPTLVHTLVTHAATRGDQTAYEYLHDDGRVDSLTYRELLARATKVAPRLRADSGNKGPALLLYPPGLDFVVAVWACFLAGVPAVPAYPPIFGSTDRIAARFTRMLEDSRAGTLLADPDVLGLFTAGMSPGSMPRVLTLDDADTDNDGDATADGNPDADVLAGLLRTAAAPEDPALIQYTS
ncbi:AMP-binding protein, partial [Streptomyces sp. I5]|uniref:AMP-binding protein n=2 Tax=unclassified Streptomyces TaxID=2593676 RepID=UPI0018EEB3B2